MHPTDRYGNIGPRRRGGFGYDSVFAWASAFNQPLDSWQTGHFQSLAGETEAWRLPGHAAVTFTGVIIGDSSGAVDRDGGRILQYPNPAPKGDRGYGSVSGAYLGHHGMFEGATAFNQPLPSWFAASAAVTDVAGMFRDAASFNQPADSWQMDNVETVAGLFEGATAFNQPLPSWFAASAAVTDVAGMFRDAASFNQPLDSWQMDNVSDVAGLFERASAFNQPLGTWRTGSVTSFGNNYPRRWFSSLDSGNGHARGGMFQGAVSFDQNIDSWETGSAVDMSWMFRDTARFNQPTNSWQTANVMSTKGMFEGAADFDQPLDAWNMSSVRVVAGMFAKAARFNQPLNSWQMGSVADTNSTFRGAEEFNQNIDSWRTESAVQMCFMFKDAFKFNQPLNSWTTRSAATTAGMFQGAVSFDQDIDSWQVENVAAFGVCRAEIGREARFYDGRNGGNAGSPPSTHQGCIPDDGLLFTPANGNHDPDDPTGRGFYGPGFYSASPSTTEDCVDVGEVDRGMFSGAVAFNQPLNSWRTSSATAMSAMFRGASSFNQNVSSWQVGSVASFGAARPSYAGRIDAHDPLDASQIDYQPVNTYTTCGVVPALTCGGMFEGAAKFNQPLDTWQAVIRPGASTSRMFDGAGCPSLGECGAP